MRMVHAPHPLPLHAFCPEADRAGGCRCVMRPKWIPGSRVKERAPRNDEGGTLPHRH